MLTERAVTFGARRDLVGILCEPTDAPGAQAATLLLNAGFLHRVGPNRLWVKLARALAEVGIASLRFDFSGIGDSAASESRASFLERSTSEAREAMDVVERLRPTSRFVPIGLCSGAEVALAVAREEPRVSAAVLINGGLPQIDASPELARAAADGIRFRYYRRRLLDPSAWLRLVSGRSDVVALSRTLLRVLRRRPGFEMESPAQGDLLARLVTREIPVLWMFSEGSATWDALQLVHGYDKRIPNSIGPSQIAFVENCDHVFTPLWAQRLLIETAVDWSRHAVEAS